MIRLKNIKMKPKLIGLFLIVGLIPLAVVGWWSARLATTALMEKSYAQLTSVRNIKKAQIDKYFAERAGDMGVLLETVNMFLQAGYKQLATTQELKKTAVEGYFTTLRAQLNAVNEDPYIIAALQEFDAAFATAGNKAQTAEWKTLAEKHDPRLKQIMASNGWYDLLLINPDGGIVYTAAKEGDLGLNIPLSDLKNTELGQAFQAAQKMNADDVAFADFTPYAPSGGKYAAFLLAQVRDARGELHGFLALQAPTEPLDAIVQQRQGLGKTGETYLVGKLKGKTTYRSDRVVKQGKIGEERTDAAIEKALAGTVGEEVRTGSTGDLEIFSSAPLQINGVNWAIISTISLEEAIVPKAAGAENDFFGKYLQKYGYYDLFLIHPTGKVFYTVKREEEYGADILNGKYANSGLGKLAQRVLQSKQFGIADFEPYAPSNNEPAAFIAQPVSDQNNAVQFIVALQLPLEAINSIMQQRDGMGKSGETYLAGADKLMRSDSFLDPVNHTVKASFANASKGSVDTVAVKEALSGNTGEKVVLDYNGNPVLSAYIPVKIGDFTWALLAELDEAEVMTPIALLTRSILISGAIIAAVVTLLALVIAFGIANPLTKSVRLANAVAEGDLTSLIEVRQKDEIGILAEALRKMVANLRETVQVAEQIAKGDLNVTVQIRSAQDTLGQALTTMVANLKDTVSVAEELAQGNLTVNANIRSEQDALGQALTRMLEKLREIVGDIKTAADNVATGSEGMSSGSEEMSQGATEQAAAAEEASSSMEEMAANIRQNADNSAQTEKIAIKAAADAEAGGQAVVQTVAAIKEIAKKIMIIEEIARQTHTLSLNATIEAAKAQEFGKGFAVVAYEVRQLAERSRTAATEINGLASAGVAVAEKTSDMLTKLVPDIRRTAELVQEISAASREQDTGAGQINKAIQQLDQVIQQNSSVSEEMAATAEELAAQAEHLQSVITFFQISEITQSTTRVRAAQPEMTHLKPKARVAHVKPRAAAAPEKPRGAAKAGAQDIDIGQSQAPGDEKDADFERF